MNYSAHGRLGGPNFKEKFSLQNQKYEEIRIGNQSRPRWSRGNVLALRSKDRGFKPG